MASRGAIQHFVIALALAALAGLAAAALVGAALTGAIDGGARGGADVVLLAERPVAFWVSVAVHTAVVVFAGGAAIAFWRKSAAA